jgi:hypothetical protein
MNLLENEHGSTHTRRRIRYGMREEEDGCSEMGSQKRVGYARSDARSRRSVFTSDAHFSVLVHLY